MNKRSGTVEAPLRSSHTDATPPANASESCAERLDSIPVLQTRVLNRRNQCYLNATVTCLFQLRSCRVGQLGRIGMDAAIQEVERNEELRACHAR